MRVLAQRVQKAEVVVNEQSVGKIGKGLLLFLGIHTDDTLEKSRWLVKKISTLRIFPDEQGKMNLDIKQSKGEVLVVSQFTLYGNYLSGRRPDFLEAALPETAFFFYEQFVSLLRQELSQDIASGVFGAYMEVHLVNDGPVTFLLEK